MPVPRGRIHVPNAATERVLAVVRGLEDENFTARAVATAVPELTIQQVRAVLSRKAKQHEVEKLGPDRYRRTHKNVRPMKLPNALVCDAVWAVLFTATERKPRLSVDIAGDAESYVGQPGLSLKGQASHVLRIWHRTGHVERSGRRGEFAYALLPNVTQRPPMPQRCPPAP